MCTTVTWAKHPLKSFPMNFLRSRCEAGITDRQKIHREEERNAKGGQMCAATLEPFENAKPTRQRN